MTEKHKTAISVRRITLTDAIEYLHRDGQESYDYMTADMLMHHIQELKLERTELLEALQWMVEDATNGKGDETVNAVGAARAAIARATGKETS
jgi:hypothetical protein